MSNIYQTGNTVRLTGSFFDWNNNPVDPDIIKLTIYDSNFKQVFQASVGSANQISTGVYYYDYVVATPGNYFYEWYGEIAGLPTLKRAAMKIAQV